MSKTITRRAMARRLRETRGAMWRLSLLDPYEGPAADDHIAASSWIYGDGDVYLAARGVIAESAALGERLVAIAE